MVKTKRSATAVDDFPHLVNDQVCFESITPAHGAYSSSGMRIKDSIAVNPSVMAHRQWFIIYDIPARALGEQCSVLEKNIKAWQKARD